MSAGQAAANERTDANFVSPTTVGEAVAALDARPDGRFLAGGGVQVPEIRSKAPAAVPFLISLRRIEDLRRIERLPDGRIRIGAMVSHARVARAGFSAGAALVSAAAREIAHPVIRNMATIGGTVALADPAADYASALLAAGAEVECMGPQGSRQLSLGRFHLRGGGTWLLPDECISAVLLPASGAAASGYARFSRVDGDYPTVTAAVRLLPGLKGRAEVRIAIGGCGPAAFRVPEAERLLSERGRSALADAGALAVARSDPPSDLKGSAEYRRRLIPVLLERAFERALEENRRGDFS